MNKMGKLTTRDLYCPSCGGHHEEDPPDIYVDFRGYRFTKPFYCICCGKELCSKQFTFARACGFCDTGACQFWNKNYKTLYAHDYPSWWDMDGRVMFQKFIDAVKAEPI